MTKILVVDDEDSVRYLLEETLKPEGFDVITANNGALALEQINQEQPDLILLDLMMPALNGFQVLQEIRADPTRKNLPVIVLTGESDPESEQTALRLGANYYVTKPWKRETLQAAVRITLREAGVRRADK